MAISMLKGNALVDLYLADAQDCKIALYTDENTEVSGGGYQRMPATFCKANDGQAFNVNAIEYPVASASWGTIKYACIYNGNDMVYRNVLTTPQPVGVGNKFIIPEHHLIVRLKGLI